MTTQKENYDRGLVFVKHHHENQATVWKIVEGEVNIWVIRSLNRRFDLNDVNLKKYFKPSEATSQTGKSNQD
jgi:hypothetical protein